VDLFDKILQRPGPFGVWSDHADGYFMFPKLEGEIGPRMKFMGKERLIWSLNNYLGLANHPEVRKVDAEAANEWGMATPMGARMMSGQTKYHEQLEKELAAFVSKEDSYLLNFGYQGMVSIIDSLVDRKDVIVYDAEAHACIMDGMRLHIGKRFVYKHNDIESCEKQLQHATKIVEETGGAILVITEGVYGMSGAQGKIKEITELKKKYNFRLMIDDAHGFGTLGKTGAGTAEHQGCQDGVDLYFGAFAKSMATIGGFIASNKEIVKFLRFNMRSQIYAKSLPMPIVMGALKRLDMIRTMPELRENLWKIVNALQNGFIERGFNIGGSNTPVTPVHLSGGVSEAANLAFDLRENFNIFCSVVMYPVIPKGMIIFRIIPTAAHTMEDVNYTLNAFSELKGNLESGKYAAKEMINISEIFKDIQKK